MKYLTLIAASSLLVLGCGSAPATLFGDDGAGSSSGAGGDSSSGGGDVTSSSSTTTTTTSSSSSRGFGGSGGSGGWTTTGEGGAIGGGGSGSTTSTSTSSTTTTPVNLSGCSDGSREYFTSAANLDKGIAGCAGGFQVAGIKTAASTSPQCGRVAGNDSSNPAGEGCSVEDLCADGWHVCKGAAEVGAKAGECEAASTSSLAFWLTRQSQGRVNNSIRCTGDGIDNVVGCGTLGDTPGASCSPLNRFLRDYICNANGSAWSCNKNNYTADDDEAYSIIKPKPEQGGVLCCED